MQEEGLEQSTNEQLGVFYGPAWQKTTLTAQAERGVPKRVKAITGKGCELIRAIIVETDKLIQLVSII